jgi:transcriptional regulator with XRE-family HTH domain
VKQAERILIAIIVIVMNAHYAMNKAIWGNRKKHLIWQSKEPTEIVKEAYNMTNNIIGERIAGLLREQDKSQRELARQTGITNVTISRYIKGDRVPKGTSIANIAKALHTTTDYLLGNEKDDDPELEYNCTQRWIARNANRWSKKQKLDLVNALFENDD